MQTGIGTAQKETRMAVLDFFKKRGLKTRRELAGESMGQLGTKTRGDARRANESVSALTTDLVRLVRPVVCGYLTVIQTRLRHTDTQHGRSPCLVFDRLVGSSEAARPRARF